MHFDSDHIYFPVCKLLWVQYISYLTFIISNIYKTSTPWRRSVETCRLKIFFLHSKSYNIKLYWSHWTTLDWMIWLLCKDLSVHRCTQVTLCKWRHFRWSGIRLSRPWQYSVAHGGVVYLIGTWNVDRFLQQEYNTSHLIFFLTGAVIVMSKNNSMTNYIQTSFPRSMEREDVNECDLISWRTLMSITFLSELWWMHL